MMTKGHTYVNDRLIRRIQVDGMQKFKIARNRAYVCIVVLLMCIASLAVAVCFLSGIHTVIPVVSVLDKNGYVVKQDVVRPETITANDSFVESQIYNFVMYCNTFDAPWRQHYSDLCRLHSNADVASQYEHEISPENPDNPYYAIGNNGRRYPKITRMSKLGDDTYQVSFQSVTDVPRKEPQITYHNALIRYAFTSKPLALGDRWENALGFAAVAYHKDQELSKK
jgi:type IV secretion system protein VirB8